MIAIEAARRFRSEGISDGYEEEEWFEQLSPNEMSLFQNLMALQIDEEAALQIAQRLDSGGVIMEKEHLLAQHKQALENCTQMEAAQKAGKTKLSIRSVDIKSAKQVCHKDVDSLQTIEIGALRKDQIHTGSILWGTLIVHACKGTAVMTILQDDAGDVLPLALYNCVDPTISQEHCQKQFPRGLRLGIKEPYNKVSASGLVALRVDHPLNLSQCKAVGPSTVGLSPAFLKHIGNEHFKAKQHTAAISAYTAALAVLDATPAEEEQEDSDGSDGSWETMDSEEMMEGAEANNEFGDDSTQAAVRVDVLCNRAASWLGLTDWKQALEDTKAVLALEPSHPKATYRQAMALTMLGEHVEALTLLEGLSAAPEAAAQAARVIRRLEESQGLYDMPRATSMLTNPKLRDDVVDFVGPVLVRMTGEMGRGLFVTEDVKEGQLLIAEKALACAFPKGDCMAFTFDRANNKVLKETTEIIATIAIQKALKSPEVNTKLSFLFDGTTQSLGSVPSMDLFVSSAGAVPAVPALAVSTVLRIIKYNAFTVGAGEATPDETTQTVTSEGRTYAVYNVEDFRANCGFDGVGLFALASFLNHNETPNIHREFIGHMLFVYAREDMAAGTELFNWYGENLDNWSMGAEANCSSVDEPQEESRFGLEEVCAAGKEFSHYCGNHE